MKHKFKFVFIGLFAAASLSLGPGLVNCGLNSSIVYADDEKNEVKTYLDSFENHYSSKIWQSFKNDIGNLVSNLVAGSCSAFEGISSSKAAEELLKGIKEKQKAYNDYYKQFYKFDLKPEQFSTSSRDANNYASFDGLAQDFFDKNIETVDKIAEHFSINKGTDTYNGIRFYFNNLFRLYAVGNLLKDEITKGEEVLEECLEKEKAVTSDSSGSVATSLSESESSSSASSSEVISKEKSPSEQLDDLVEDFREYILDFNENFYYGKGRRSGVYNTDLLKAIQTLFSSDKFSAEEKALKFRDVFINLYSIVEGKVKLLVATSYSQDSNLLRNKILPQIVESLTDLLFNFYFDANFNIEYTNKLNLLGQDLQKLIKHAYFDNSLSSNNSQNQGQMNFSVLGDLLGGVYFSLNGQSSLDVVELKKTEDNLIKIIEYVNGLKNSNNTSELSDVYGLVKGKLDWVFDSMKNNSGVFSSSGYNYNQSDYYNSIFDSVKTKLGDLYYAVYGTTLEINKVSPSAAGLSDSVLMELEQKADNVYSLFTEAFCDSSSEGTVAEFFGDFNSLIKKLSQTTYYSPDGSYSYYDKCYAKLGNIIKYIKNGYSSPDKLRAYSIKLIDHFEQFFRLDPSYSKNSQIYEKFINTLKSFSVEESSNPVNVIREMTSQEVNSIKNSANIIFDLTSGLLKYDNFNQSNLNKIFENLRSIVKIFKKYSSSREGNFENAYYYCKSSFEKLFDLAENEKGFFSENSTADLDQKLKLRGIIIEFCKLDESFDNNSEYDWAKLPYGTKKSNSEVSSPAQKKAARKKFVALKRRIRRENLKNPAKTIRKFKVKKVVKKRPKLNNKLTKRDILNDEVNNKRLNKISLKKLKTRKRKAKNYVAAVSEQETKLYKKLFNQVRRFFFLINKKALNYLDFDFGDKFQVLLKDLKNYDDYSESLRKVEYVLGCLGAFINLYNKENKIKKKKTKTVKNILKFLRIVQNNVFPVIDEDLGKKITSSDSEGKTVSFSEITKYIADRYANKNNKKQGLNEEEILHVYDLIERFKDSYTQVLAKIDDAFSTEKSDRKEKDVVKNKKDKNNKINVAVKKKEILA